MFIDPHVHFRDFEESYKETINHGLYVAELAGMTAVFDMPNTKPTVTGEKQVVERLKLAKDTNSPVFYGLYMALTADTEQVKRAIDVYRKYPQVVGFKLYAGHSTNDIGVTEELDQFRIYHTLACEGYEGVLAVHCEKESRIKKNSDGKQDWDPSVPITHAKARPPHAEVDSGLDMIHFQRESGFTGTLLLAHTSVPDLVEIAYTNRLLGSNIRIGVTPHHILFDENRMAAPDGLEFKMNPPLRPAGINKHLLDQLKAEKIDWIETDHAPHTRDEKYAHPYASGIPGLHYYPTFVRYLRKEGFSGDQIDKLTFENARITFGKDRPTIRNLEQRAAHPLEIDGLEEYKYDPLGKYAFS